VALPVFFFFGNEQGEPPHVHVKRDRMLATCWLEPIALARSTGSAPKESRRLERVVRQRADGFREAWHAYFDH
jgi:hypothetical protein